MTGLEFRKTHGDPGGWNDDEYDLFQGCATPGDPRPALELLARLRAARNESPTTPTPSPKGSA